MNHDFDWNNPYPTVRTPVFARNVVATSQPLAAQAGLRMLAAGGNAIDAVIAAATTISLTERVSIGRCSDAFAIVWHGEKLNGLNASGWSPATWDPAYYARRHGGSFPMRGWDSIFDLNVKSAYVLTREAGKHMLAQKSGAIVNISSGAGINGVKGGAHYSAAKSALQMFTRVTAAEWGRHGVRANCSRGSKAFKAMV